MEKPRNTRPPLLRLAALLLLLPLLFACRGGDAPEPDVCGPTGPVTFQLAPDATATPRFAPTPTPEPPFLLNAAEATVYGGGVCQLVAYENPGMRESQTVQWRSSDERVAIVEAYGVVIGLSPGTAQITAEANNGTGETAICTVTVTSERPQPKPELVFRKNVYKRTDMLFASKADRVAKYVADLDPDDPGVQIALSALRYVGYYYGTKEGNIDCSMLLLYAALDNGYRLPRRSDWQAAATEARVVPASELQPGDLMFFAYPEDEVCSCSTKPVCKRYLRIHHAAVYLGKVDGGRYVVEASSAIGRVVIRFWDGSDSHAGLRLALCTRLYG